MSKSKNSPLGKAIIKSIQKKNQYTPHDDMAIFFQKSETNEQYEKALRMKSIIERDSLTQFLVEAEMSGKDFEADRNLKMKDIREQLINKKVKKQDIVEEENKYQVEKNRLLDRLRIPRKPAWTKADTKTGYLAKQNEAFLDWRRKLAQVQQKQANIKMTPFEKNIEVWKQLWRVVERANILIQIVDARDPLFYRCQDLQTYVKEVSKDKRNLLLINKSDLVEDQMREIWSKYLNEKGINHIFFSAKIEQKKIDEQDNEMAQVKQEDEELQKHQPEQTNSQEKTEESKSPISQPAIVIPEHNTAKIASVQHFLQYLKHLSAEFKKQSKQTQFQLQVGMVGYPNVGKSSVINSLLNKKKVGVASQPGKTKHYQTLYLTPEILLCDCPGLVFPNVASTTAEMVLNGVIPIDNLREYQTPVAMLVQRIPRSLVEQKYGLKFKDDIYNGETLLQNFANLKGFHTGRGLPNESMAARIILKDYTNGYLSHCKYPPGMMPSQPEKEQVVEVKTVEVPIMKKQEKVLDEQFFDKVETQISEQDEAIKMMTEDDLLDLIEGKLVGGLKLKKDQRKELKFAMKRGETVEDIKKKYLLTKHLVQQGHKQLIKN